MFRTWTEFSQFWDFHLHVTREYGSLDWFVKCMETAVYCVGWKVFKIAKLDFSMPLEDLFVLLSSFVCLFFFFKKKKINNIDLCF